MAGFKGGATDNVMMRFLDMLYSLPLMFFVQWLTMSRIVRGQMVQLRSQEFVVGAHALGLSNTRIIFRHMIPNPLRPIIVYSTLTVWP